MQDRQQAPHLLILKVKASFKARKIRRTIFIHISLKGRGFQKEKKHVYRLQVTVNMGFRITHLTLFKETRSGAAFPADGK